MSRQHPNTHLEGRSQINRMARHKSDGRPGGECDRLMSGGSRIKETPICSSNLKRREPLSLIFPDSGPGRNDNLRINQRHSNEYKKSPPGLASFVTCRDNPGATP